ncbi:MAG: HD domain-containing protein [Sulfuricellaceae bacterium]|nr:HD domain-containing protein [Sulfuricellaceae bacterium]
MFNVQALTQAQVQDREDLEEFLDDIKDLAPKIEQALAKLKQSPRDRDVIANLFRIVHNIKGDAALCHIEMGVIVSHPIETLLGRLRAGELEYSEGLGEIVMLAIDRLELAVDALVKHKAIAHLRLVELVEGLEKLHRVDPSQLDAALMDIVETVTGFRPVGKIARGAVQLREPLQAGAAKDLHFFRTLAQQFEGRSSHFRGRVNRTLRLALETNRAAGKPVDPLQLEAAVYLHDVGMMFLPEHVWLKQERLSDEDKKALQVHPAYGAGLLSRMGKWQAAAEIVAQHHEMADGAGYPQGLTLDRICPGAQLLSIVDAFESVMLKHSHRGRSRSLLRAIAEVNACNNQFAAEWIGHFNTVIRRMIES